MFRISFTLLAFLGAITLYAQDCFRTDFDDPNALELITVDGIAGGDGTTIAETVIENGSFSLFTMGGHEEFSKFTLELHQDNNPIVYPFDYSQDDIVVRIRARASSDMALRVFLQGENGALAQTNDLQYSTSPDENTFDLLLTAEYQEFEINFADALWDQWTGTGSIYCPGFDPNCPPEGIESPLQFIHMSPNPAWASIFHVPGFDTYFEGEIEIDYIEIGYKSADCSTVTPIEDETPGYFFTNFDDPSEKNFVTSFSMGGVNGEEPETAIFDSKFAILIDGHAEYAAFQLELNQEQNSLPEVFDYDNEEVYVQIRARANTPMALRATLEGENGVVAQNNELASYTSLDDNTFDLELDTEFKVFTINFTNNLWDEWNTTGSIHCPASEPFCPDGGVYSPIKFINFYPNPFYSNFPVYGYEEMFSGGVVIDYIYIGNGKFENNQIPVAAKETMIDEVGVYPIPAEDQLTVSFGKKLSGGQIAIYDLLGNKVLEVPYKGSDAQSIDVSALNSNMYMLRYEGSTLSEFSKIQIK